MFFIMQLGPEKGVGVVMAEAVPCNKTIAPISNIVKLNSVYLLIFEVFKYQSHPVTIDSKHITCKESKNR